MLPRSVRRSSGIPAGVRDRPYQCGQCPPLQKVRFRAAQPRPSLDTTIRARSPNRASFTGRHPLCNRPSAENCPDEPDIATALRHAPPFSRRTPHESPNQGCLRQPQRAHAPRQPRRIHCPAPRLPLAPVNPGLLLPWQSRSRPSSYRTRASSRTTVSASLTGTQSTPHADQGSSIQGPGIRSTPVPGTAPELSFRFCRPLDLPRREASSSWKHAPFKRSATSCSVTSCSKGHERCIAARHAPKKARPVSRLGLQLAVNASRSLPSEDVLRRLQP